MSEDENGVETNLPEQPEHQTPTEPPEQQPPSEPTEGQLHLAGVQVTERWSAPLPPPKLLREFNEAVPGAANIIVSEFQEQGQHRRGVELLRAKADVFVHRIGGAAAPLIDVLFLAGGFGCVFTDRILVGVALLVAEMLMILWLRWRVTGSQTPVEIQDADDSDHEERPT